MNLEVEVQFFPDCPHAQPAIELVRQVIGELAPTARLALTVITDGDDAAARDFLGSPSIRVAGRDIEGRSGTSAGLTCRTYEGGAGLPPRWLVEAAILAALEPKSILFLCVANSARSQIGEGVARKLLGPAVRSQSAGSKPTRLRAEAARVLAEIDIDTSTQHAKLVNDIDPASVDTVITLCGEEECPLFLGAARRLHWGLADPAAIGGDDDARLAAFRQTRDELERRLSVLVP